MPKLFLAAIGFLYLYLSIWCATSQDVTSQKVGLTRQAGLGESEYLTIYGGLQLALAAMFVYPLLRESALENMLLCCVIVHACLVLFRTIAFFQYSDFTRMTYQLASAEWAILLVSIFMYWWQLRGNTQG